MSLFISNVAVFPVFNILLSNSYLHNEIGNKTISFSFFVPRNAVNRCIKRYISQTLGHHYSYIQTTRILFNIISMHKASVLVLNFGLAMLSVNSWTYGKVTFMYSIQHTQLFCVTFRELLLLLFN